MDEVVDGNNSDDPCLRLIREEEKEERPGIEASNDDDMALDQQQIPLARLTNAETLQQLSDERNESAVIELEGSAIGGAAPDCSFGVVSEENRFIQSNNNAVAREHYLDNASVSAGVERGNVESGRHHQEQPSQKGPNIRRQDSGHLYDITDNILLAPKRSNNDDYKNDGDHESDVAKDDNFYSVAEISEKNMLTSTNQILFVEDCSFNQMAVQC